MTEAIICGVAAVIFSFLLHRVFNRLDELEKYKVSRSTCELINTNTTDKFTAVDKKIDTYHTDNKEDHEKLESLMKDVGESVDHLAICVTKLSANIKCE